jgi:hypothetical protein
MQLTKWLKDENVDILFDTVVSQPIMEKGRCTAVIVENKTGTQCYEADIVIDATGDADVLYRAGVPTVQGKNYHTFYTRITSLEDCANAIREKDIKMIYKRMVYGGTANLFGEGQPENKPLWLGTTAQDVTNYVIENHLEVLEKIANDNRKERDISELPYMPQFRTTRRIDGEYTLSVNDLINGTMFDDVIAISSYGWDLPHPKKPSFQTFHGIKIKNAYTLIPYRCLVPKNSRNIITAGRCISVEREVLGPVRVMAPCIAMGEAAGIAAYMSMKENIDFKDINISELKQKISKYGGITDLSEIKEA